MYYRYNNNYDYFWIILLIIKMYFTIIYYLLLLLVENFLKRARNLRVEILIKQFLVIITLPLLLLQILI